MYFLYSLGGVTFNKCWITLSILNCYSPNFQGFILMKNALNNQVGMLGDMFLWLVANLKQGVIYFIKQALPPNISAGSVCTNSNIWWMLTKTNLLLHSRLICLGGVPVLWSKWPLASSLLQGVKRKTWCFEHLLGHQKCTFKS